MLLQSHLTDPNSVESHGENIPDKKYMGYVFVTGDVYQMFLSHSFMSIPYNPKQIKYINQKISGLSPDVRRFSNLYSQTRRRPCKSSVFIQISMIPKSLHKNRSTGYHINHELIWTYGYLHVFWSKSSTMNSSTPGSRFFVPALV